MPMTNPVVRRAGLQLAVLAAALLLVAVLSPSAHAQTADPLVLSAGDLIKLADDGNPSTSHDAAVYYYAADNKRYVFPNAQTYFTWYGDFSGVRIVSAAQMSSIQIGGNVTYRPGTRLVKITSDPKVYAVEPGGLLRPLDSEAVAKGLYGDNWNKIIDDVPDAFFFNYTIGSPITAVVYPTGTFVKRKSDGAVFRIEERQKRHVTSMSVLSALRVQEKHIVETDKDLSDYPDASDLNNAEPAITDTAETGLAAPTTSIPTLTLVMPASSYASVGGDTTLMELKLTSVKEARITKLTTRIDATTGDTPSAAGDDWDPDGLVFGNNARANLSDIHWVDAQGTDLMGRKSLAVDVSQDQSQTLTFTGSITIPAGQEKRIYLKAKLNDLLPTGVGYQVTLPIEGINVIDASTGQPASFSPDSDIVGPNLSTLNSKMRVRTSFSPGTPTQEFVRGAEKVLVNKLKFEATKEAPNVITGLDLQGYIDEEDTAGFLAGSDADNGSETLVRDVVPRVYLYDSSDNLIAGPVDVSLAGEAKFTGLSYHIPAGGTAILSIKGDTNVSHDLESKYDKVMFDVDNAMDDVDVTDDQGGLVLAEGVCPNGCEEAYSWLTVRYEGEMEFRWRGRGGDVIAGRDIDVGELLLAPKYDSYLVTTLSFRLYGTYVSAPGPYYLHYPKGGSTAVAQANVLGSIVTFNNLDMLVSEPVTLTLKTSTLSRTGGAVYDETFSAHFSPENGLRWVSQADDTVFDSTDLGSRQQHVDEGVNFWMEEDQNNDFKVRWSELTVEKHEDSPADFWRDEPTEVLRFTMTAEPEGPIRIKQLVFHIVSGDSGSIDQLGNHIGGVLDYWATKNGDSADDDSVADLVWLSSSGNTELWGEGGKAELNYRVYDYSAGLELTNPVGSEWESGGKDVGILEYVFSSGQEPTIPAGTTYEMSFRLDMTKYQSASYQHDDVYNIYVPVTNSDFEVSLMGNDYLKYTDIPSGAYTPYNYSAGGNKAVNTVGHVNQ